jgi:hypothetical protein
VKTTPILPYHYTSPTVLNCRVTVRKVVHIQASFIPAPDLPVPQRKMGGYNRPFLKLESQEMQAIYFLVLNWSSFLKTFFPLTAKERI